MSNAYHYPYAEFICQEKDLIIKALYMAVLEAETLLTNYLVDGKFPPGSDCQVVRDKLRSAIEFYEAIDF